MDPLGHLAPRVPQGIQGKAGGQVPLAPRAVRVRPAPQDPREARGIPAPWALLGGMAWQEPRDQPDHQGPPAPRDPPAQHWMQVLMTWKVLECPSGPPHEELVIGREGLACPEPRGILAQRGPQGPRERWVLRAPAASRAFLAERAPQECRA